MFAINCESRLRNVISYLFFGLKIKKNAPLFLEEEDLVKIDFGKLKQILAEFILFERYDLKKEELFSEFCYKQNRYVFVVPSYEATKYLEKCLNSIDSQRYPHYRVIIINDASSREHHFFCKSRCNEKYFYVKNKSNKGALYNIVFSLSNFDFDDEEIIILLDGDDWLTCSVCLDILNREYTQDVLLTYGNFIYYNSSNTGVSHLQRGFCKKYDPDLSILEQEWVFSHLRTFKYRIFREIDTTLLLDENGMYYAYAWDLAIMYLLIHHSYPRIKFIDFPFVYYNIESDICDFKKNYTLQKETDTRIRKKYIDTLTKH